MLQRSHRSLAESSRWLIAGKIPFIRRTYPKDIIAPGNPVDAFFENITGWNFIGFNQQYLAFIGSKGQVGKPGIVEGSNAVAKNNALCSDVFVLYFIGLNLLLRSIEFFFEQFVTG